MPEPQSAAELHERLRLIALHLHGLDGYADACEDAGDLGDAEQVRESLREIRSLIPETADPKAFKFEWAVEFTSKAGRISHHPARDQDDALDDLGFQRDSAGAEHAHRYKLARRPVGGWETVDD